jgi:hypothetical protein
MPRTVFALTPEDVWAYGLGFKAELPQVVFLYH